MQLHDPSSDKISVSLTSYKKVIRMTDTELQDWLRKKSRIDDLPSMVWEKLEELGLVKDALPNYNEVQREDLLVYAKIFYQLWRDGRPSAIRGLERPPEQEDSEERESFQMEPNGYERERSAAYSEYLAKLATDDPLVRGFRRQILGSEDKLLTPEEAEKAISDGVGSISTSRQLSRGRAFPWPEEQAEWFLLTGEAPDILPLRGRVNKRWGRAHNHGVITLEIESWVSPEVVKDAYSRLQKRTIEKNNRRMKSKTLALFRFVVEQNKSVHPLNLSERKERAERVGERPQTATELSGPSWREMMKQWNERFPRNHEWHYKDEQNFARDFRNAERRIANPVKG